MKISIITAVRNGVSSIRDCLESIQNQSYPVEHIIIDGGSGDGTLEIIQSYSAGIAKMVSEPDSGIYDAMNKGIGFATGDVVGVFNADDFYADENVLSRVVKVFEDSSIDSCYGDLIYVASVDTNRVIRYWKSCPYNDRLFYRGWMPPHPTFFVRREVYERCGLFNPDLGTAADYELMLRFLVRYKITSAYLSEIIIKMRSGGASNASLINRLRANRMDRLAWKVNGLRPYPWTLWMKPLRKVGQYLRKS